MVLRLRGGMYHNTSGRKDLEYLVKLEDEDEQSEEDELSEDEQDLVILQICRDSQCLHLCPCAQSSDELERLVGELQKEIKKRVATNKCVSRISFFSCKTRQVAETEGKQAAKKDDNKKDNKSQEKQGAKDKEMVISLISDDEAEESEEHEDVEVLEEQPKRKKQKVDHKKPSKNSKKPKKTGKK
jgi:hypothetical protein